MRMEKVVGGRACVVLQRGEGGSILIQPVDDQDRAGLEEEFSLLLRETGDRPVALAAFPILNWQEELSPWPAPPVWGKAPFGQGAEMTLAYVTEQLMPALGDMLPGMPRWYLGGYSLAGLFALWAGYRTDAFCGVAGASPSLWFPGWDAFAQGRVFQARHGYLSLGDREEKARNPVMAGVGDAVRRQADRFSQAGVDSVLHWNPGNHFQDAPRRMARGFAWLLKRERGDGKDD